MDAIDGAVVRFVVRGATFVVDASDADAVREHAWCKSRAKCGRLYIKHSKLGSLARWLMGAPQGMHVDHINGDTLDNRRANLRVCTHQQNQWNRKRAPGKSRFKGVTHFANNSPSNCWVARIEKDAKRHFLGGFSTPLAAALAYDTAAVELFGEFAAPNFPERFAHLRSPGS